MRDKSDTRRSADSASGEVSSEPASVGSVRSAPTEDLPPGSAAAVRANAVRRRAGRFGAGDVFAGRYRIVEMVGRGGFCEVGRAVNLETGEEVALKFLRESEDSASVAERMHRELRLARDLRHPNIVRLHDLVEEDDRICLVMELVVGRTLKDEVRSTTELTVSTAVEILTQLASAVGAVHAAGIVHRDLKPQNVMVAPTGEVKLLDFGLARASDSTGITVGGAILGTPDYMSPEQVNGGTADARSDVYSLGVMAWELFAGRPPYTGETPISIAHQHVHSRVPTISDVRGDVPRWISELIGRMTEPEPDRRPSTAEEVLLELDRSGAVGSQTGRSARSALAWTVGGGAGVVAIVAVVVAAHLLRPAPLGDPFSDGAITAAVRARIPVIGSSAVRRLFLENLADAVPENWSDSRIRHVAADGEVLEDPSAAGDHGVEHIVEISLRSRAAVGGAPRVGLRVIDTTDGSVWWQTETAEELTLDYGEMVAVSGRLALLYQSRIDETFASRSRSSESQR